MSPANVRSYSKARQVFCHPASIILQLRVSGHAAIVVPAVMVTSTTIVLSYSAILIISYFCLLLNYFFGYLDTNALSDLPSSLVSTIFIISLV